MKFHNIQDKRYFLLEVDQKKLIDRITDDWKPTPDLIELFIKKRKELVHRLKDFRKRQNTKAQWRKDRYKIMKGIKRFHKSTIGKRFHRALGTFIATRENFKGNDIFEIAEFLKSLSSMKTHAFIEIEYYCPLDEYVDYLIFIEEMLPMLDRLEKAILNFSFEIDEDDQEFLIRICETTATIRALADKSGKDVATVEKLWKAIKASLIKDGKSEDNQRFFGLLVSILKKKLGITK